MKGGFIVFLLFIGGMSSDMYLKFIKKISTFTGHEHSRGRVKNSKTCGQAYEIMKFIPYYNDN